MLVPGAVITIGGAGPYPIPYPPGATNRWTQLKLENATAYGLTIYLDGTPVHSMAAGTADVFPLTAGPSGPDSPTSSLSSPAPQIMVVTVAEPPWGDTPGYLRPSFGDYGDNFPGTYPLTLAAQTPPVNSAVSAYSSYRPSTTGGFPVTIFANPPAGSFWEIAQTALFAQSPGVGVAGYLTIQGLGSNIVFNILSLGAAAPYNVGQSFTSGKYTINEGLQMNNVGTGATTLVGCTVIARLVPTNFAPI